MESIKTIKNSANSIVIPIRIQGKVTSISIKKYIIALWILLSNYDKKIYKKELNDFIYGCSDSWEGSSAKGFSDYCVLKMIISLLEENDSLKYKKILEELKKL